MTDRQFAHAHDNYLDPDRQFADYDEDERSWQEYDEGEFDAADLPDEQCGETDLW